MESKMPTLSRFELSASAHRYTCTVLPFNAVADTGHRRYLAALLTARSCAADDIIATSARCADAVKGLPNAHAPCPIYLDNDNFCSASGGIAHGRLHSFDPDPL